MKKTKAKKVLRNGVALAMASLMLSYTQISAATVTLSKKINTNNGTYTTQQGMCMDTSDNFYIAKQNSSKAVKIYKTSLNGSLTGIFQDNSILGHANDMTYCSKDNCIYIATGGGNENPTSDIISIKNSNGSYKKQKSYSYNKFDDVSGIAYDETLDVFYLKKGKKVNICKLINGSFQTRASISLDYGAHEDYTGQGISAYDGKIFVPLWDKNGQNNSVVRRYRVTKHAETVYSISYLSATRYDNDTSSNKMFEVEGMDFSTSGKKYFATNGETNSGGQNDGIYTE